MRQAADPFKWSDIRLISGEERFLARALVDNGFPDGLAVPCHGPFGYLGVISLAFERLEQVAPSDQLAIKVSSLVLHNRMRALSPPAAPKIAKLSRRERDCMGFVALGKSDWEISVILGVSHTTAITHLKNAKRKLGVSTRAQAVARCISEQLI